ncbi:hypothetical protein A3K01_03890 [candidate division WWE3 bacterium RIFOXYD1_FULL_43_17]|uniref:Uncharacterized protein n=3 Tax=Katanobacteria TaxID=422282 RepID=A0A1F4XF48_UNCKA|nr:MAG: hypothetical protein UU59_C0001G0033 [candidate division WWE3 bacterium GW2011_GWE1_41_27]KKS60742.1 MAG: hypothetical protein UV26_C0002G0068 [candidate division WWE3 bacterium GW2011_GWF2_42_42]OGC80317.1 MAG: hypothetical protein A3K01_03890 [candidate division WWE3 bacterium RIFOXYD1_FULL_43_17]
MKKLFSFIFAVVGILAFAGQASAATSVVYDALPSIDPLTSYPSQPFQAQQTKEFGDYIHLDGTSRILDKVTVTMVTWARYSEYSSDTDYNGTNWTLPITLNVYNNHLNGDIPDQKIATVTQVITVPWRLENNSSYCTDGFKWWNGSVCLNGFAFNATFDLSSLNVTLPDDIIVSVAFNTQSWGYNPIGEAGPYNSLNVAIPTDQVVLIGEDNNTDGAYWNTTYPGYTEGFREDTGWTPNGTVALQVTANATTPTIDSQCKNNGWKNYIDGDGNTFKNQGACVSYVAKNSLVGKVTGDIQMSDPSQKMIFDAFDYGQNSAQDKGSVEYWNYDYPGILHYTANVLCATVDKVNKTARFMFQVPELGNIYVVSYVSDLGTPGAGTDTYGHGATDDLTLAKQWCETGGSFSSYTITDGNLVVHK